MNTFKTPKGTTLPILNLKGKDYLQVAHRLVWFREEHADWGIETEITVEPGAALAKAYIKDPSGRIIATATKFEDKAGFADYIEKAETGAIGRALALCGYGTQYTVDLDEGERLADAPIEKKTIVENAMKRVFAVEKKTVPQPLAQPNTSSTPNQGPSPSSKTAPLCSTCGTPMKISANGMRFWCPSFKTLPGEHPTILISDIVKDSHSEDDISF